MAPLGVAPSGRDNWRRRLDGGADRAGEAPPRDD
jgi:hypothetical protein